MTFHCDRSKGQLKTYQSTEPLLIDAAQEAMGPVVSTLGKEIDKKIGSLEEETNKRFENLEQEIRNISNLQRRQIQSTVTQQSKREHTNTGAVDAKIKNKKSVKEGRIEDFKESRGETKENDKQESKKKEVVESGDVAHKSTQKQDGDADAHQTTQKSVKDADAHQTTQKQDGDADAHKSTPKTVMKSRPYKNTQKSVKVSFDAHFYTQKPVIKSRPHTSTQKPSVAVSAAPQISLEHILTSGVNAIKEWTGMTNATFLYDSTVDPFTADGLFEKVKGKPNIAVIGFTTDGDVFGGFYSVVVTEPDEHFFDPNMFAFSFESHGRCATPQRFTVKRELKKKAYVYFCKNDSIGFVVFWACGAGGFWIGNELSELNRWNLSRCFEGIKNTTLTGKRNDDDNHCTRIVAIQFE